MKYLLVLGGNSVRNRQWGEACVDCFRSEFDSVFFPHYDHWSSGAAHIDLEVEMRKVNETVTGAGQGGWYIFAKSIGSVLALRAIERGIISPAKCVFFGMPLNIMAAKYGENWSYLSSFKVPALAFHNDQDPTADYRFTAEKLREFSPNTVLQTDRGDTHDYLDFAAYRPTIKEFLIS